MSNSVTTFDRRLKLLGVKSNGLGCQLTLLFEVEDQFKRTRRLEKEAVEELKDVLPDMEDKEKSRKWTS